MRAPRRVDPTAKSSLMIALIMHVIAFLIFFVWAAKTGRLDPVLNRIHFVQLKDKEKKEPPKQEKKDEEIKQEELPQIKSAPKAATAEPTTTSAAPPPVASMAAPPPAAMPAFFFSDGAKIVDSSTNAPILHYKSLIEGVLRANWERPKDVDDTVFLAEANVYLDGTGKIQRYEWQKGSGNSRWDDSVKKAIATTRVIGSPPPKGFPGYVLVRFDVAAESEPVIQ